LFFAITLSHQLRSPDASQSFLLGPVRWVTKALVVPSGRQANFLPPWARQVILGIAPPIGKNENLSFSSWRGPTEAGQATRSLKVDQTRVGPRIFAIGVRVCCVPLADIHKNKVAVKMVLLSIILLATHAEYTTAVRRRSGIGNRSLSFAEVAVKSIRRPCRLMGNRSRPSS